MGIYTEQNIYNFSAYAQCKLATIGKLIAQRLAYKDLCIEEKLAFILAQSYVKIIKNYTPDSCVTEEQLCIMVQYVKKYLDETSYHNNSCNCH